MILPEFEYKKPKTIKKALQLYQANGGNAVYLSGGTDLVPRMKQRLEKPIVVIDLKNVTGLNKIELSRSWLKVGANVTLYELKNHPFVKDALPAFAESLEATACETIQMRGTIGGNVLQNTRCLFYNKSDEWRKARGYCIKMGGQVCNAVKGAKMCFANYASDNAPALITLGAHVSLSGIDGKRQIPLDAIFSGKSGRPFALKSGEILTHIMIPTIKTRGSYLKIRVRDSIDYPLVGVAMSLANGKGCIAIGAIGGKPLRLDFKEDETGWVDRIAQESLNGVSPVANTVLSPAYRKKMVGVLVKRIARKLVEEDKR
jgi:4-hydroxybenzoyl-CoA reductase subunit beta